MTTGEKEKHFDRQRLKWIIIAVLLVQIWHFKIMEDHNGDKIFTFRLVPTWELISGEGRAVVLEYHDIETNYGPVKLKPFKIMSYRDNTFSYIDSRVSFDAEAEGLAIKGVDYISILSEFRRIDPPISIGRSGEEENKAHLLFNNRLLISSIFLNTGLLNDSSYVNHLLPDKEEAEFLSTPHYGVSFSLERKPESEAQGVSDFLVLKDGTQCDYWSSSILAIPEDTDWRLSSYDGYENPEYVYFPNGESILASFVFFEPEFGPVTKIVTPEKVMLGVKDDYSTYVIEEAFIPGN